MLSLYLILLCLFGVNAAKQRINIAIFVDKVLEKKIDQITDEANWITRNYDFHIGGVSRIWHSPETDWPNVERMLQSWDNGNKRPGKDVIFDFTKDDSTHRIKEIARKFKLPVISTNLYPMPTTTELKSWTNLTKEESKYLIQVGSPSWKLETTLSKLQISAAIPSTIIFDGQFVNTGNLFLTKNGTLSHMNTAVSIAKDEAALPGFIPLLTPSPNGAFLIGGETYIDSILKGIDKLDKHLFDDKLAWYAGITEFGALVKCPKSLTRGIIVVDPLPPIPEKQLKEAIRTTKFTNITDYFYLDMILAAARTAAAMLNENVVDSSKFQTYLATELKLDSNYLGSYHFSPKLGIFQPNLSLFNVDLVKFGKNPKRIGKVVFDDKLDLKIRNAKSYSAHAPSLYFNATVVVDEPFVIRNETCVKEKLSSDKLLSCYYGYVIDVLHKILQEYKKIKISVIKEADYGSNSKGATHDMTLINRHNNAKTASSLSQIGIGAFSIDSKQNRSVLLTHPIYKDLKTHKAYSIALDSVQGVLLHQFSHVIKKLENQKYLEQLKETWFVEHKCKNCKASDH